MKEFESQFNAIKPEGDAGQKKKEADVNQPENPSENLEGKLIPLQETDESVSFLGVETAKGQGGPKTPPRERFQEDVVTNFDHKLMRDIAVAFRTHQPIMLQGGSGIGKSRTVDRMCGLLNREVYYADCHQFDADSLIGKMTALGPNEFGWRDGVVIQAIRNGGILFLDEYNFMSGEVRASLHEILDAVLQGKNEITLVDNHGERVPVHPDFQIVAAQNPPGGEHGNREVLDPAQYTRFSHINLPEDLPREVKKARALGRFGFDNKITLGQSEYLYSGGISLEALKEIPGLEELIDKYIEFNEALETMIEKGDLKDGPQPIYFAFQRDYDRVISFVRHFYRGDINETFAQALRNNYVNRFIDPANRAKVEEMIRHVRYEAPQDDRRKGLEREKKGAEEEPKLGPEGIKEKALAEEMLSRTAEELKTLKTSLRKSKKEISGEAGVLTLSAEYKYKDEKGKEIRETIEIDFEEKLASAMKFYEAHRIDTLAGFEDTMKDIWERNESEIQKQIEEFGFDEILIIPANVTLIEEFDQEMTKDYKKKDGTPGDPTYWGVKMAEIKSDERVAKSRIILVHKNKAGDLYSDKDILPILKETLGKKAERQYFEETGEHLDGKEGAIWLPGSRVGDQVVRAFFDPGGGQLGVRAAVSGHANPGFGCRPSRCFF